MLPYIPRHPNCDCYIVPIILPGSELAQQISGFFGTKPEENKNAFPLDNSGKKNHINNKETDPDIIIEKEWAIKHIADKVEYPAFESGRKEKIILINRAVETVNRDFRLPKLGMIGEYENENNACYRPEKDALLIGRRVEENVITIQNEMILSKKSIRQMKEMFVTMSYEDILLAITYHEMGHRVYQYYKNEFDRLYNQSSDWANDYGITTRAKKNRDECSAENVAAFYKMDVYTLHPKMEQLYKNIKADLIKTGG